MLAFEQQHQQHFPGSGFDVEAHLQHPYPQPRMNSYGSCEYDSNILFHANPLPFPYFDNRPYFPEVSQETLNPGLIRTTSASSAQKHSEMPPSLLAASAASIPSAASSTVSSPYSGHSHMTSANEVYGNCSQAIGFLPTIVNQDGFSQNFVGSTRDFELFMIQNKVVPDFVGKSADLYRKRSSTFTPKTSQSGLSLSSYAPISALPNPMPISSTIAKSAPVPAVVDTFNHLPPQSSSVFKSPSTPGSAYARSCFTGSPSTVRHRHMSDSPMQQQPCNAYQVQHMPSVSGQQHPNYFQSDFFSQSSGNFMPPLEVSCSFIQSCVCLCVSPLLFLRYLQAKYSKLIPS